MTAKMHGVLIPIKHNPFSSVLSVVYTYPAPLREKRGEYGERLHFLNPDPDSDSDPDPE